MANNIRIAVLWFICICTLLAGTDVSEERLVTSTLRKKAACSSEEVVLSYLATTTSDDLDRNKNLKLCSFYKTVHHWHSLSSFRIVRSVRKKYCATVCSKIGLERDIEDEKSKV
jgi:hypothetical protein